MKIDHIALYCRDIEQMRTFFMMHFACTSGVPYHNPRTGLSSYFLSFPDGEVRLEIMARPDVVNDAGDSCLGYTHLALSLGSREAVDAKTAELQSAGCSLLSGPRVTGDGYYESCLSGPEGICLELTV